MKKNLAVRFCALALLVMAVLFASPVAVAAADTEIHGIDVTVDLAADGSATITEVWDVEALSGITEWYVAKYNLDEQEISGFTVSDETGLTYEYVENWDTDASREEKAGKCGILQTSDGPELCWGIGSFGSRTFMIRYSMTNVIKAYNDADAVYQYFVTAEVSPKPEQVRLTIRSEGIEFTQENTGVWAFSKEGMRFGVENGEIVLDSGGSLRGSEYVSMLVEFDKGMFQPVVERSRSFESLREEALEDSEYREEEGGWKNVFAPFIGVIAFAGFAILMGITRSSSGGGKYSKGALAKEYKEVPYSRAVPWKGSMEATYSRLADLRQLPDEGAIIGAYLLRWVQSKQVELVSQQAGFFGNKQEDAIKLYDPRPGMEPMEYNLYNMLVKAAGPDWILQSKEFEKWSKKNYTSVQGWLEQYKNSGKNVMRQMGAAAEQETKTFFGLLTTRKTVMTPLGETLTKEMFGFKKYLEDFTIVNEREAREVQLWNEYLVFAQLYGIADKVAEQFKQLYPDYFRQMATDVGAGVDMYDIIILTHMMNRYSYAMSRGYQAGYAAAHSTLSSGGGGFSPGGGGFSASGGGGGGGGR